MTYEPVDIVKVSWGKYHAAEHPGRILADITEWRFALVAELERLLVECAHAAAKAELREAIRLVKGERISWDKPLPKP